MKKNANILDYVEEYKYKYGINYATEKSSFVKKMYIAINIFLIYVAVWFPLIDLGVLFNVQNINDSFFGALKGHEREGDFYILLVCFVLLIVLIFIGKKNKLFLSAAVPILPIAVYCVSNCTKNNGGFGYLYSFYLVAIPAAIVLLLVLALIFVLIRAQVKTNKIYDMLVEALYKQYGTRDGEKLDEQQWQDFLSNYNPKRANSITTDENKPVF